MDKITSAYECLKYVRIAPGKVYEYELYPLLSNDFEKTSTDNVAKLLNDFFGLEFAICDIVESSHIKEGLNVIYTNPEYRLVLDLLLYSEANFELDKSVYIDNVNETIIDNKMYLDVQYNNVEQTLTKLLNKHPDSFYVKKASEIYKTWPKTLVFDIVKGEDIFSYFDGEKINLSNKCLIDVDIENIKKENKEPVLKNFIAENSYFTGKIISFENSLFEGAVSFKGSIFNAKTLTFKNSLFRLEPSSLFGFDQNEVTLRNTKMFVENLLFDEIIMCGDISNKLLSLEDAVIDATYISFSKMNLNDSTLFCYQTIMPNADIYMVEAKISEAKLNFEDSIVDDVIMLNVMSVPETQFGFRKCDRLIIENCNINDNIFIKNMNVLSLRACKNQGKILTDWDKKVKDSNGNKNYPILLAIMNNSDKDEIKAEQFIMLKENFLSIGQYDYEDEAFIQYMNYKCKNSKLRPIYELLRKMGDYGISPAKVLLSMLWTVLSFGVVYFVCYLLLNNAFGEATSNLNVFEQLGNSFYLSIANLVSYDCTISATNAITIVFTIIETIIGWFLLGYLSIAVVRKTLR